MASPQMSPFAFPSCPPLISQRREYRSPQRVIQDMIELSEKHHIYDFTIADSLINSSDEWLEEFTDILLEKS